MVFATDVDSDGNVDVLSASYDDGTIAWYKNDGASPPNFEERVISNTTDGARSVFAIDVDGDGDVDVLSASENDNTIAWYENDGGSPPTFKKIVITDTVIGPMGVFAIDVDGDNDIDALSGSWYDDTIAWYESDGGIPPNFKKSVIASTADGTLSIFATDVDGDGDVDVLSASFRDNTIAWYVNDGGSPPTFEKRVISLSAEGARSVVATDMDGDGDVDVLSASSTDNTIAWYASDGGYPPEFEKRVITNTADRADSIFAIDVDGDGDIDVVSVSFGDDTIAWYESDGNSPPKFEKRVISTFIDGGSSVFAIDVDGDGDIDVVSTSSVEDRIAWFENKCDLGGRVGSTYSPTSKLTTKPTSPPTYEPTIRPASPPTYLPTTRPTLSPTRKPSMKPTSPPTYTPTMKPTSHPTTLSTIKATSSPTFKPAMTPTPNPALMPTTKVTFSPTSKPTTKVTFSPTPKPTMKGMTSPSPTPTSIPSSTRVLKPTQHATEKSHSSIAPTMMEVEIDSPSTPMEDTEPTLAKSPEPTSEISLLPTREPTATALTKPTERTDSASSKRKKKGGLHKRDWFWSMTGTIIALISIVIPTCVWYYCRHNAQETQPTSAVGGSRDSSYVQNVQISINNNQTPIVANSVDGNGSSP